MVGHLYFAQVGVFSHLRLVERRNVVVRSLMRHERVPVEAPQTVRVRGRRRRSLWAEMQGHELWLGRLSRVLAVEGATGGGLQQGRVVQS